MRYFNAALSPIIANFLPAGAQFLNVIESVFSGMARAIIHNSDYKSVGECRTAIDRYFEDRNQQFKKNPKRSGKKFGERSEKKLSLAKAIIAKILYIDERSKKLPLGDSCYYQPNCYLSPVSAVNAQLVYPNHTSKPT